MAGRELVYLSAQFEVFGCDASTVQGGCGVVSKKFVDHRLHKGRI